MQKNIEARRSPLTKMLVGEYFSQHLEWLDAWASCQIRKIGFAHAPECRERFPRHRGFAIPTCITAFPGACATPNFTYRVRGPLKEIDIIKATQIFTLAPPDFKEFLLNGVVLSYGGNKKENTESNANANEDMRFCITKRLHAAAIYHSNDVLRFLRSSGIDVFQVDDWRNNVFHNLIQAVSLDIMNENRYVETLVHIRDLLSDAEIKQLMLPENDFSPRPLEFATFHGCLEIMDRIMETKGVYLYRNTHGGYNVGYDTVQYFDVSDYECFDKNIPQNRTVHLYVFFCTWKCHG